MLPDHHRQLLTAFVDGELSGRQRRQAQRLLRRSAEARKLLRGLQEDARCLRSLPHARPDADLSGPVLRAIADRALTPRRQRPAAVPRRLPAWSGLAAAAAILVGLGLASFFYFSASLEPGQPPAVAKRLPDPVPPEANPAPAPGPSPADRTNRVANGSAEKPDRPQGPEKPPDPVAKLPGAATTPPRETKPRPEGPPEGDVLTGRMEMFQIDRVNLALPVILRLHNLDQEPVRQQLLAELARDHDFRLELPCRTGTRALEGLLPAFLALKLALFMDPLAQVRLKLPQVPSHYAIYLENVTAEELARLLLQVGQDDKKVAARKPLEAQFDRLVLTRMTAADRKELAGLLGTDPTQSAAPAPTGPLGTDPRQPLSELTAKQVGEALAGQGGAPRPEVGKPPAKAADRQALVLLYNPAVRPHPASPEVTRFLETRKPARPGTLRILLVLRG
jgi:hypothetical protein